MTLYSIGCFIALAMILYCIAALRPLESRARCQDFRVRFITLLAGAFRAFAPALALSVLDPKLTFSDADSQQAVTAGTSVLKADGSSFTAYDLKRLQVYRAHLLGTALI